MLPRPLKRSVQLLISCLFLILATGCSDVKFGSDSGGSSKLSASSAEGSNSDSRDATPNNTPEAPADPNDPIIDPQMPTEERDQNMENQACLSILDMATGNQDPRSGRNFNTSGSNGNVFVENMDNVNVSGTTTSLGVFGANIANKNENIRDICIVARNINFSGTIKNSTNAVFVGETGPDDSFIAGINGNNHGELLLKDITVMNI